MYLQEIIVKIIKDYYENVICIFVDSSNYDNLNERIEKNLKNHKKVVVISSYASISAGVNLQYNKEFYDSYLISCKTPNYIDSKKDFDEIFLGDLTYSEPVINDETTNNERLRYLYLLQEFYYLGLLNQKEVKNNIRAIFRTNEKTHMRFKNKLYFDLAAFSHLIQAIGRITRTNNKNKNIYIYYSAKLVNRFSGIVFANEINDYDFLPIEAQKLFDDLQNRMCVKQSTQDNIMINQANYTSE